MKNFIKVLFLGMVIAMFGCKEETPKYPVLDLLEYGFPISIHAPSSSVVKSEDYGIMKELTIKDDSGYDVVVYKSQASTRDLAKVKSTVLTDVKTQAFFGKIVEEYPDGFIFEKKIGDRINFDFRRILIQGSDEYLFQTGLAGTFTEEDVRSFYSSVK